MLGVAFLFGGELGAGFRIEFAFPLGDHDGAGGVAEDVHGGTGHVHHAVDTGDDGDAFERDAHLGEHDGAHDEAGAGHAHGTDGSEDTGGEHLELLIEGHGDAVDFSNEDGDHAHVHGGAVHVDGVAEGQREGGHGLGSAELLALDEVGGQGGGGADSLGPVGGADERGLSGSSYVGQTVAVYDAVENKVVLYLIQPDRSLLEVGAGSSAEEFETLAQDIETLKTSLNNIYTKEQTNTAIAAAVANSAHLSRKIVESYDDIDVTADDAHLYIYMVPNGF